MSECLATGVWGPCPCNRAPLADAGEAAEVPSNTSVTLDGSRSIDPDGDPLRFQWQLGTLPTGSAATLDDPTASSPTFFADVEGIYVVTLVVSDDAGAVSAPVSVTLTAINFPPVAEVGPDQNVYAGTGVTLSGSGSDPNGDPITLEWTLTAKPAASGATLDDPTSPNPTLVPDVDGSYELSLVASDGRLTSAPATTVVAAFRRIEALPYRVSDAEYSIVLDAIVMVAANPAELHVYDATTDTDRAVALPLAASAVSVGPDGRHAAVGHDGWVSYVDLDSATLLDTFAVTTDAVDVVLGGNGYIYAFPRRDQWEEIHSLEIATGVETLSGGSSIRAGTLAKLHPDGNAMYGADNGLSPSDIERYDITGGTAQVDYDSPYHGDYPMCGDLWMAEDGLRIFTACGNVFRASPLQAEDMTYNGALTEVERIGHLTHSMAAGQVLVLPEVIPFGDDETADTELQIYGYDFLAFQESVRLPSFLIDGVAFAGHGRFVFASADGSRRFVVLQADESSGLLADFGVVTYALP